MIELFPEVSCDGGCEPFHPGDIVRSMAEVRRQLAKDGWKRTKHGDFCPKCVARKRHLRPSFYDSVDRFQDPIKE